MYAQQSTREIYRQFGPDPAAYRFARILNRRLLIVEDDTEIWPLLQRIGQQIDQDLAIDFVDTVDEAIDRLAGRVHYDAVLVDDCLPLPGEGERLRVPIESLQPWARVAMMSSRMRSEPSNCAFLPKPFTPNQCGDFLFDLLM